MNRWTRFISAIGGLFVAFAIIDTTVDLVRGGALLEVAIDFVLICLPGAVLLFAGRWLTTTELNPRLYPRIVAWCLGGAAFTIGIILLRAIHPGVSIATVEERMMIMAIGSVAGLGIGVREAQAIGIQEELVESVKRLEESHREREEMVEKLEESNMRLEQFAYVASHDLQEPLRTISSYLQLIESRYHDDLDEDARDFIDFAVDGAERMRDMIDGLLVYSRVETEGEPFGPVDLTETLEDVVEDLRTKIEESDARITADPLPLVSGDKGQLRQLFQNLIDNAIEYSGDDPPRVHISADRNGAMWTVTVRDEGIGIDPANANRIFDVFQRLHTQRDHPGTGIGLALCKRIIERHDGEIWVESRPKEGATFSFTLPVASDSRRERAEPAVTTPSHTDRG